MSAKVGSIHKNIFCRSQEINEQQRVKIRNAIPALVYDIKQIIWQYSSLQNTVSVSGQWNMVSDKDKEYYQIICLISYTRAMELHFWFNVTLPALATAFTDCFSWSWLGWRRSHEIEITLLVDGSVVTLYTFNDAYCLGISRPCFLANYTSIADSAVVGTNSNFSSFKF